MNEFKTVNVNCQFSSNISNKSTVQTSAQYHISFSAILCPRCDLGRCGWGFCHGWLEELLSSVLESRPESLGNSSEVLGLANSGGSPPLCLLGPTNHNSQMLGSKLIDNYLINCRPNLQSNYSLQKTNTVVCIAISILLGTDHFNCQTTHQLTNIWVDSNLKFINFLTENK